MVRFRRVGSAAREAYRVRNRRKSVRCTARRSSPLRRFDIHTYDQVVVAERVHVPDHLIRDHACLQIAHHLVNGHDRPPELIRVEGNGFDPWVQRGPLAQPVVTHFVTSVEAAAFPRVGPIDVRMECSGTARTQWTRCLVSCEKFRPPRAGWTQFDRTGRSRTRALFPGCSALAP
jgi:hypothetical protein